MKRVLAVMACGFTLAACSMSMPSLDFLKSSPATETLRVESEPPGADARTTQGQSCRTPCELSVSTEGELSVTFALSGYQPTTVPVRMEGPTGGGASDGGPAKLQPNPVFAELQPATPSRQKRAAPPKKKTTQQSAAPAVETTASTTAGTTDPYPPGYPWPQAPR
jgi:PEGA domain-containing protein